VVAELPDSGNDREKEENETKGANRLAGDGVVAEDKASDGAYCRSEKEELSGKWLAQMGGG
jgi:hypothetical protein